MSDDPLVQELLSAWERGLAEGRDVPAAELCRDRPDLATVLASRIQAVRQMNALAGAGRPAVRPIEQVVTLCEGFNAEWDGQTRPSLYAYLTQVGADARPALLRELLAIEVRRRRAAGERPSAEEYLPRLPSEFAGLVRDVFRDLPTVEGPAHPAIVPPGPAVRPLVGRQLGDYLVVRELGRGGMGVVYEARHAARGDRVALKTLPAVDGAALHRFKREFRALADLNHPNLVGLLTLEADAGRWFFTMELLQGEDFLSHVRPRGALDEPRLRAALAQLAAGVTALHARNVVHRDLKPGNVMVTDGGRVVLLDFGLVSELNHDAGADSSVRVSGTPVYMAPEQAAACPATPASDWYSVGVMLYEALCGKPPFTGPLVQVLLDKQQRDAPPLPAGAALPADLAALALRLVARDPQARAGAAEVARVVSAFPAATPAAPRGESLVGRAGQLAELDDAYRTFRLRDEPLVILVGGRSGEGKTALAEHFLAPLRRDPHLAVMSGRCYDRESVPFKALDTLIDALAGYLRSLSETDAALLMPDDIGALARVFPVLQRVPVVERAAGTRLSALDAQQVRQRAFLALRSLLTRISRHSPVVWFIDDLQWGDADSAAALFEVLRPPEAPALLLLGTYRSDEAEGSAFLKEWHELQQRHRVEFNAREVRLAPLSGDECAGLVVELLGRDDEATRRRAAEFARETRGNPFLLTELVGCLGAEADSFRPVPLDVVMSRKLARLPAEAAPLLEVVAVSGQALAADEAARAAGHDRVPLPMLLQMRKERIIRLIGPEDGPLVDTYHDRVRETVLQGLPEGRRKALHLRLGEVIEQGVGAVPDVQAALERGEETKAVPRAHDLAYHFDAAGEKRKAWVYALLAAEQARRQFALGIAVEQYAVARRNADEAPAAVRCRLATGCAEALVLLGRYDEAAAQLEAAARLTDDPLAQATIEGYQGEVAVKRGRAGEGAARLESALRRLGRWVPRSRIGLAWGLLRESIVHCWHRFLPGRLHGASPSAGDDLAGRLLIRLGYAYLMRSSPRAAWAALTAMNHAERFPASPVLAFSYAAYGFMLVMFGRHARALHYLDRSVALRRDLNDLWGMANSLTFAGSVHYQAARYREGVVAHDAALDLYHKTGDPWEINANRLMWVLCQEKLGNVAAVIEVGRAVFARDVPHGDDNSGHFALFGWSLGARGNLPFDELRDRFQPLPDNVMATAMLLMGEGYWHWFHSRTGEALRAFESAWERVKTSAALNHMTVATLPWLVTALRRHADALESTDGRQCQRLRKRAFRLAKWATRLTRFFPPHYSHSLRELSHAYAARGRLNKALALAEKSCAVAEAQGAKYEHAESLLLRGRLEERLGLPGACEHIRTAETALAARDAAIRAAVGAAAPGQEGRD